MSGGEQYALTSFERNNDKSFPKFTRVGGVIVQANQRDKDLITSVPAPEGVSLLRMPERGERAVRALPNPAPTADLFDLGMLEQYVNEHARSWNICIGRGTLSKLIHLFDPELSFHIENGFLLSVRTRLDGSQIVFEDTETWSQTPSFGFGVESLLTTRNVNFMPNDSFTFQDGRHPWQYEYCTVDRGGKTIAVRHEVDCFDNEGLAVEIKSHNNRYGPDGFHNAICVFLGCTDILVTVGRDKDGV